MKSLLTLAIIAAAASLIGCSTVTSPDGTKTVKPDNRTVVPITDLIRDLFAPPVAVVAPAPAPEPVAQTPAIIRKTK